MTASRSPVALAFALLVAGASLAPGAHAQGIVDTLRSVLGPPVEEGAPARQRPRTRAAAAPRDVPATVPVPSARPGEAGAAVETNAEAPAVPEADETDAATAVEAAPQEAESEPAEAEATAEPELAPEPAEPAEAVTLPIPEPSPHDEPPPQADAPIEPDAVPADAPAAGEAETEGEGSPAETPETAETPEIPEATEPAEPAPGPAYVSPEKARTVPEPSAPSTPPSEISPEEAAAAAAAIEDARLCEEELSKRGAEFTTGPSIAEGACGVLRPVQLTRLSSGVTVSPATQMLCRTALALDIWAADGIETAARNTLDGGTVDAIEHASTYVCRDRASESGISEHGRGSAIDIAAFVLANGRRIVVEDQAPQSAEDRFLADARRAACGPFATVLGPGTDADHADHLHLDIAARANGSLYCR